MFHHILVPVDGSDTTNPAVEVAMRLAHEQKAVLRFVTVVEDSVSKLESLGRTPEMDNPRAVAEGHKEVLRDVTNVANKNGCAADFQVLDGTMHHAGELIAKAADAWDADLIVMGSHGRHGLNRLAFGSVTEATLRRADVPVLVIPARAGDRPGEAA